MGHVAFAVSKIISLDYHLSGKTYKYSSNVHAYKLPPGSRRRPATSVTVIMFNILQATPSRNDSAVTQNVSWLYHTCRQRGNMLVLLYNYRLFPFPGATVGACAPS